jgi:hypothetical protein
MISRALSWMKQRDEWSLRILLGVGALSLVGWVFFFSRYYLPPTWDEPLLAVAAILIGMKLGAFILLTAATLAVKAFRWLRTN